MSLDHDAIPWSFELAYDASAKERPFVACLVYGGQVMKRNGSTATDAVEGLLRVAEHIEDPEIRRRCRAAIRRGLGREAV